MKVEVARYLELHKKRKELEAELDTVKEQMAGMESTIIDEFDTVGVESIKINGHTIYKRTMLWAGAIDGDYDTPCRAMKRNGMKDFVHQRFNVQQLSSYIRELDRNGEEIPKWLADKIRVTERVNIQVRKS